MSSIVDRIDSEIDRLYQRADALAEMRERYSRWPSQEEILNMCAGEEPVIWFQKTFGGSRVYTYAAVYCKASDSWYSTGPRAPKDYRWDDLVRFMQDGFVDVWICTAMESLF